MTYIIIGIVFFVLWYISGLWCFYYWWTKEFDLDTDPNLLSTWFVVSVLGPINWYIGKKIDNESRGKYKDHKVLFKKRKK